MPRRAYEDTAVAVKCSRSAARRYRALAGALGITQRELFERALEEHLQREVARDPELLNRFLKQLATDDAARRGVLPDKANQ